MVNGEEKLLRLKKKQKVFEIGKAKIGGRPGELPTVLVGNVFYKGMPEVINHRKGTIDKKAVANWLDISEALSDRSGVPHILDVMSMYPEAVRNYILYVSEKTDSPFMVDGANPETRIAALDLIKEIGLQERVVFNGIDTKTVREELEAIQDSNVKAAVIIAYNETDYSPEGRLSVLRSSNDHEGLLDVAERAGIENALVDTVVFDVPSISYAAEAIKLVKKELGYPAGCSPANATYLWKSKLKDSIMREGFAASNVSAHTIAQCSGADFLIYGPIKQVKNMIPAVAINDAIIAYFAQRQWGTKPMVKDHPLYKIF